VDAVQVVLTEGRSAIAYLLYQQYEEVSGHLDLLLDENQILGSYLYIYAQIFN